MKAQSVLPQSQGLEMHGASIVQMSFHCLSLADLNSDVHQSHSSLQVVWIYSGLRGWVEFIKKYTNTYTCEKLKGTVSLIFMSLFDIIVPERREAQPLV